MSSDPRRQKSLQLVHVHVNPLEHTHVKHPHLYVQTKEVTTGIVDEVATPFNAAHTEMCLTRASALQRGLDGDGLCRPVDIDNLLFVAQHPRDISRMRKWPFTHQVEDMEEMLTQPWFFITSEMRTGKSKIVIDAIQYLYEAGTINKVIIEAPAPVRDVWADPVLGELKKHLWLTTSAMICEYHGALKIWQHGPSSVLHGPPNAKRLEIYVTNYEFLRSKNRLHQLMPAAGHRTLLVLDETSYVKNHASAQTISTMQVRRACGRVVMLNGTPIFHSPLDLFSQGNLLHASVLQCPYITYFKGRYAVQEPVVGPGGKIVMSPYPKRTKQADGSVVLEAVPIQSITGWSNLDDLERRFKPFTVRRLQKDCLDLPRKLDPVNLTATMHESWPAYKAMRDHLVVWLKNDKVATSATAAVKSIRLSQITSGFLGGIEDARLDVVEDGLFESLDFSDYGLDRYEEHVEDEPDLSFANIASPAAAARGAVEAISREKLDVLLWLITQLLEVDPNLHLVVWSRFRPEVLRTLAVVREQFPQFETGCIMGAQKRKDRMHALALLKPETSPRGPVFVAGIEGTGSFGLDMTAAHTCVTMSGGYSSGRSKQTLDRLYGPAQTSDIAYYNIVAVGPKGQRTIDHDIIAARLSGENIAERTTTAWVKILEAE